MAECVAEFIDGEQRSLIYEDDLFVVKEAPGLPAWSHLVKLELKFQNLSTLSQYTFSDLTELREIICENNSLRQLPEEIFHDLTKLQSIRFSSNQISELKPQLLDGLSQLHEIDFSYNQINHLEENLFQGSPNLSRVVFTGNQLTQLSPILFSGLTYLTEIHMSENRIARLDVKFLENLHSLKRLDLSNNLIRELPSDFFHELANLTHISFQNNQITQLPSQLFADLIRLEHVNFSSNRIRNLPSGTFTGLIALREIDFSSNQLTQLDSKLLAGLDHLQLIDFRCDLANIDSFSFWDHTTLLSEFFLVDTYDTSPGIWIKTDVFAQYVNMWCLSRLQINNVQESNALSRIDDLQEFLQNLSLKNLSPYFDFETKFTPLDFLLAIDKIPNKLLTYLINNVNYILRSQQISLKNCQFKIKHAESIASLCRRDNQQLINKLSLFVEINDFSRCFETALGFSSQDMAVSLIHIFWPLILRKFREKRPMKSPLKSDDYSRLQEILIEHRFELTRFLSQCAELEWWSFYQHVLELFSHALDDDCRTVFLLIFEHELKMQPRRNQTLDHLIPSRRRQEVKETLTNADEDARLSQDEPERSIDWQPMRNLSKNHLLYFLTRSAQSDLILHPTTQTILRLKWQKLPRLLYYVHFVLYLVFLTAFTVNLEFIQRPGEVTYRLTRLISLTLSFVFLLEELVQIGILRPAAYLNQAQNIFEMVNYPLCSLTLIIGQSWPQIATSMYALCIILSYAVLILRLEKLAVVGIYVSVMKKIVHRSVKVLPLMILASLAFFFAFRVTSRKSPVGADTDLESNLFNGSLSYTLVKLLTMNLGDFETDSMGLDSNVSLTNMANYAVYATYLFVLPILVVNIFVGISVDEIRNLIDDSQNQNIILRSEYVLKLQDILVEVSTTYWARCVRRPLERLIDWGVRSVPVRKVLDSREKVFNFSPSSKNVKKSSEAFWKNREAGWEDSARQILARMDKFEEKINEIGIDTDISFIHQKNELAQASSQMSQFNECLKAVADKMTKLEEKVEKIEQATKLSRRPECATFVDEEDVYL